MAALSHFPFDTCRAEIYRRQRNSCLSRCKRPISPADHPAGKLQLPDRPEHRRRSQCTQWDRCTIEVLHRKSGGHHHRCGPLPDGYIHRTHIDTRSVFRPETGLGTDVGHPSPPMHGPYQPPKGVDSAAYKPSVKSENHPADPVSNPATQPALSSNRRTWA